MSKKRISRKNKGGDCYVVAGHFAMGDYRNIDFQGEPFVVHAEVLGQGAISGVRYGHAWVEDDVNVYDFSNNRQIVFPKDLYYAIGNVKTDNPLKYQKYTFEQARKKMLETGIYGCWDIQTEFAEGGTTTSKLKAPNGKPSNLNPEQWKLVRTPEFKAWFGDWENDPENASKVVDENGEPLVVHNGTNVENPFYIFDFNKADLGFHFGTYEQAKSVVNSFFLNIQNIYEVSDIGEWEYPMRYIDMLVSDGLITESDAKKNGFYRLFHREDNIQIREYLFAKYGKFIGFKYNNKYEGEGKSFIVLNPEQIKLADGSNTIFDGNNPDIRFAEGGRVQKMIENGAVELKVYDTTPEHAKEYGLIAYNPLYIQRIFVNENDRNKGLGKEILQYLDKYAKDNGNDLIFGHIQQKANPSRVKSLLEKNGYTTIVGNNDFYKFVGKFAEGGTMNTIQQGDALIYKDSELLDFDNVIYVEHTEDTANGTLVSLSNGQTMFLPQVLKKFRKASQSEINRSETMSKEIFSKGGKTKKSMKRIKRGGITYGKSHAEGGIPVKNESTGDMLEVEGGEGIVNKRSMASADKVTLNGKQMTICEAVSELNQMEGGVKFNCNDVEHRQFLEEMARGGELERGTRTENEHIQVLRDLYAKRITPKEATRKIAKDHLKEDSKYYSKLAKMEGKMANGGKTADNPFAEFGLIKDFKGDAFEKLDAMERVDTNYCEINKTNCSSTKGIDRKDMPQIYEEHIDEYIDFLDENGVTHNMEWGVEVGKLKPTQANISVPRIKKILTRLVNGYYTDTYGSKLNPLSRRLLATKDGFILDGHHRWASLLFLSPKNKIDVFRINADINDIIQLSKKFDLVAVSEFAYGGKVDVKVPNYTSSLESDINTTIIKRGGFPQAGLYFAPTYTRAYDDTTQRASQTIIGYTNEMVTLEIGTRNFYEKRIWGFSRALETKLKELQNEPKYEKFKDLIFERDDTYSSGDSLAVAKKRYEIRLSQGQDPSKLVMFVLAYGKAKGSINLNIYTPPALDYLTQGEEFFDFIFDAVNELSKEPNKNTEASKKLAKEESTKRKEAQKGEQEKIVKSTEYPKEITEFNPRHLYRFKTATELELQYNTTDWKDISIRLNCDWLKKSTNRKILGLKVPKEAQYIIKFLVSTTYIFSVVQRETRNYYIDDFDKVFNIDLDAYKIKKDEIDKITKRLFTIETENYFEQSDVQSDVGAKILNESELQIANLNKEDFYQEAIKLASPTQVSSIQTTSTYYLNEYTKWYNSKIELICESEEHNAFIPSELWQYLKYVQEQNLVLGQRDNQWNNVVKIEMQNGEYVGLDYYDNVVKSNIDERIVNFLRFYNFVNHTRFSTREVGTFDSNSLAREVIGQIFSSFRTPYISSLGLVSSLMDTTDQAYIDLSAKHQKAYDFFNFLNNGLSINDSYGSLYSIDTSSAFFEEVDFNQKNVNLEFKYLSKEQLGDDDIAIVQYIDKVFCGSDNQYEDNLTYSKIGFPSAIELVLGEEVKDEVMNVFKTPIVSQFRKAYAKLDTNKFYPSNYSNQFPPSFDDLKEDNGGYKANGAYIPIGWVKFLLFAKEHLQMENVQTDNALISYFYDGSPEFAKDLRIANPYQQIDDMFYTPRRAQVGVYDSYTASYQISVKIGALSQAKLVKKKNKFEEEISSLTQLLQVFGNDEPLKQNIIYNKIARVRKEQEAFIQKRYFKGDLSKLLQLYADGQKLGGQRDLANVVQCGMTTPTGEPSELDLMQYKLVRTPEFKKWFGDWEEAYVTKDYSAVSKAINPKTAEPIVCYHGKGNMRAEATYFNLTGFPVKYVGTNLSYSIWFARNRTPISVVYEFYAKLINPIDLSKAKLGDMTPKDFKALVSSIYGYDIKTNLIAEDRPQRLWQILRANPLMLKELRDNTNYDGLIIYEDNPSDVLPSGEFNSTLDYIVFSNMQLKSADNRNSTFLIDSPDFRFDDGGLIKSDI
jgi:GNAT superfamily N-acetyltransferase